MKGKKNEESVPGSTADAIKSRSRNGLGPITVRLLNYMKGKGSVKINDVAKELAVPIRRMYDVTTVLKTIGIVEKTGKNCIRLSNEVNDTSIQDKEMTSLKHMIEKERLEKEQCEEENAKEGKRLDKIREKCCAQQMYVTVNDILSVPSFKGAGLIALQHPHGSELEIDMDESDTHGQEHVLEIRLNSDEGMIEYQIITSAVDESAAVEGLYPNIQYETSKSLPAQDDISLLLPCAEHDLYPLSAPELTEVPWESTQNMIAPGQILESICTSPENTENLLPSLNQHFEPSDLTMESDFNPFEV